MTTLHDEKCVQNQGQEGNLAPSHGTHGEFAPDRDGLKASLYRQCPCYLLTCAVCALIVSMTGSFVLCILLTLSLVLLLLRFLRAWRIAQRASHETYARESVEQSYVVAHAPSIQLEPTQGEATTTIAPVLEHDQLSMPEHLRVLVADDSRVSRILMLSTLRRILPPSTIYCEAETGEDALQVLLAGGINVAILDEIMEDDPAGLVGTEVARHVRRMEQQAERVTSQFIDHMTGKCVLISWTSSASSPNFHQFAATAGMDCVWGKPLPADKVLRKQVQSALLRSDGASTHRQVKKHR